MHVLVPRPVRASFPRVSFPAAGVLLAVSGAAWLWVALRCADMGSMAGSMGLALPAFVGMWTVMMTAMMLPSTAPLASTYARSMRRWRSGRMLLFAIGYLLVWTVAGVPAYLLAVGAGQVAARTPVIGTAAAVVVFLASGLYQLSGLKDRCLAACRAPLGVLLRYLSWGGRLRDVRVGMHHGLYCLGCCWALMALMLAFGLMNLWVMAALALVVTIEKVTPSGQRLSQAFGLALVVAALAVPWLPALAPGLTGGVMEGM